MTKKLFVVLLLSLFVAACDSGTTEPNSNVNNAPKVNTNQTAPASPATSPSPEAAPKKWENQVRLSDARDGSKKEVASYYFLVQ